MSFLAPLWLLVLVAVPVLLALYMYSRRRARRFALRFPATDTAIAAMAAAGRGAAWRRHLPSALALAAIAALAVALARPQLSYRAAVDEASMMLVTDHSGSMAANDVQPTRLAAAERAANTFIDALPRRAKVGAVAFSSSPDAVQGPVVNHGAARAIIDAQSANGATATGDALALALQLLRGNDPKHPPSAIVLLSDGAANAGADPLGVAQLAGHDKIPIFTVALGTRNGVLPNPDPIAPPVAVPPDPQLMQQIAHFSGGRTFNAITAAQLSSIYQHLGTQLATVTRHREVTAGFAAAGVVLLLLAVAGTLRWTGRIP